MARPTPSDRVRNVVESRIDNDHYKIAQKCMPHIENLAKLGYTVNLTLEVFNPEADPDGERYESALHFNSFPEGQDTSAD